MVVVGGGGGVGGGEGGRWWWWVRIYRVNLFMGKLNLSSPFY